MTASTIKCSSLLEGKGVLVFSFAKCHNLGNDFILIDDRRDKFPFSPKLVQKFCRPHLGIGADGLILLKRSKRADFRMRLFNSDGSEAKSCGNGLACLALFIQSLKLKEGYEKTEESTVAIETLAGEVKAIFKKRAVTLQMPDPKILQKEIKIDLATCQSSLSKKKGLIREEQDKNENGNSNGKDKREEHEKKLTFFHVDTGVEHAVTFVDDFAFDLEKTGKIVRHHAAFQPQGVNVDFAKLTSSGIDLRVYEKGVEAETLACGTGAIAAALAAFYLYNIKPPILINFKQGSLKIDFEIKKDIIKTVRLIAFPSWVYSGNFLLD